MFALLFGSYSIPTTVAGIPSFFLLKSMILYFFFAPPPRCLTVILPWALRPAFLFLESRSDFSYTYIYFSEKSDPVICLLEGVYGLYVLIPITFSPFVCSNYSFHGFAPFNLIDLVASIGLQFSSLGSKRPRQAPRTGSD